MSRWFLVVALACGCSKKTEEAAAPPVDNQRPAYIVPAPPAPPTPSAATPTPTEPDAATQGSRDVPGEKGVPLDRSVLGSLPHPFGALDAIKPTSSRDDILSAVPGARRDGDDIVANVGVEDLVAMIAIDAEDRLDGLTIKLPRSAESYELLEQAWGKATAYRAWFNSKQHWRADWDDASLQIGPYLPLADILGSGPEGLSETKPILGVTVSELKERFGKRLFESVDPNRDKGAPADPTADTYYGLMQPATEVCRYDTGFSIRVHAGRAVTATMRQCFDDESMRRAALAVFESKWGRAVPGRTSDDHAVFVFTRGTRRFEMSLVESSSSEGAWQIEITAAGGARRR